MSSGEGIRIGGSGGGRGESLHDQVASLRSQLASMQRFFDGMTEQRVISMDGTEYAVLGKYSGQSNNFQPSLRVIFEVENEMLYGLVSPHGFLSCDSQNIFQPVVPVLNGVKITDDTPPKAPLSSGMHHLVLKTAGGRGVLEFLKAETVSRPAGLHPNEWHVLARFTVDGLKLDGPVEYYNTAPQSQISYAPQFQPILWTEDGGKSWKCQVVSGYVWDVAESARGIKGEFSGGVQADDKLLIQVLTDEHDKLTSVAILNEKNKEGKRAMPALEDQGSQNGEYYIELCTFRKIDTDTGSEGDTHTLFAEIHHVGPIIWRSISFANIGDGEGKLLKDTQAAKKLQVKSIKNVGGGKKLIKQSKGRDDIPVKTLDIIYDSELTIEGDNEHVRYGGNKNSASIVFTKNGAVVATAEFKDGLRVGDTTTVELCCDDQGSSSNASIP